MEIKRARECAIQEINEVIKESKAHWNYPAEYLLASYDLLFINQQYLTENLCFEIIANEKIIGFFAITEVAGERYLDHLWIAPSEIGKGYGREANQYIENLAAKKGWPSLLVLPDPGAMGFYEKAGFRDTRLRIPSRIPNGPIFSVQEKHFCQEATLGNAQGLSHVTLGVKDIQESFRFYHEVLGFNSIALRESRSAYLRLSEFWLALVESREKLVNADS